MSLQEAVFILHEHEVIASHWLSDFEQIVRRQLPLAQLQLPKLQAAYVHIGNHRCAEAMVLFELPMVSNAEGANVVANDWYMPLRRLADSAGRGPNMGAGRIKLACQSQCSISWHSESLWEPVTSDFMAVRKALRENRLNQNTPAPQPVEWQSKPLTAVERVAGATSAGSLLAQKHSDPEVEDLKRTLRTEVDAYRNQLQQLQQEIERQRSINEKLSRQNDGPQSVAEAVTPSHEVEQLRQLHCQQVAGYEEQIEQLKAALDRAADSALADSRTAVEANDSHQADQQQIAALSAQIEDLQERSVERFVSRVSGLDAVLVAFHPGAGHLTITPDSMQLYADNPIAYAAQKCFVAEEKYRAWLDHYDDPRCQQCQTEVPRIEQPRDFEHRLSAYCKLHRQANLQTE